MVKSFEIPTFLIPNVVTLKMTNRKAHFSYVPTLIVHKIVRLLFKVFFYKPTNFFVNRITLQVYIKLSNLFTIKSRFIKKGYEQNILKIVVCTIRVYIAKMGVWF